jgi:hypothetical protein
MPDILHNFDSLHSEVILTSDKLPTTSSYPVNKPVRTKIRNLYEMIDGEKNINHLDTKKTQRLNENKPQHPRFIVIVKKAFSTFFRQF